MRMTELYAAGEKNEIGTYVFTEEKILSFARKYDPQRFHTDKDAAKDSMFGGLCASGWHTTAAWMQCFLKYWMAEIGRLKREGLEPPNLGPSPGFQKLQWMKPVFVDEMVSYSVTFLSGRPLASRPGWHVNSILCEGVNQDGIPVIRFESSVLEFE